MNKAYPSIFKQKLSYNLMFHTIGICLPFFLSILFFGPGHFNPLSWNRIIWCSTFSLVYSALMFVLAFVTHGFSAIKLKIDGFYIFFFLLFLISLFPKAFSFGVLISSVSFTVYYLTNQIQKKTNS